MSRAPWPEDFPPVFVHGLWQSYNPKIADLKSHALYAPAKGQRDIRAAIDLMDDFASERTTYDLFDFVMDRTQKPILIAPAAQISESNNALAIGHAQWLGKQHEWPVEERVFQAKKFSRDLNGAWPRIANRCEFYGEIDTSRDYVIVDDVITLGGTLADLRSFIVGKGGRVIATTAIASRDGRPEQLRLNDATRKVVERLFGSDLPKVRDVLGYDHSCLTDAEGRKIGGCDGYDDFRKRILRARNACNAR